MLINFISNLPRDLRSGGFSAMNAAALQAIERDFPTHYAGPVNLDPRLWPKLVSKALRMARLPGEYFFYSQAQLDRFAGDVARLIDPEADLDFFHGFTPWISTTPARPYATWSDCTFRDYVKHYNRRAEFRQADLARIERAEAGWLRGARAVGFTSNWAAKRAIADYGLDPARVSVVGIFGEVDIPVADTYADASQFAFISTDFEAKGGPATVAAFRQLRARFPSVSLVIVGDIPAGFVAEPGIETVGFLRKEVAAESSRLREILAKSRAVVLPTKSDIAPLLLVEAAYFGCPAIATRGFAIEEIVQNGVTGLLIDDPDDVSALAETMAAMVNGVDGDYRGMRQAAWMHGRGNLSKDGFSKRLLAMVHSALASRP